jgi:two-component system, LytTR family, response regulator
MITSIIIDDESKARIVLNAILEQYCPDIQVVEQCSDLPSGIKAIKKHRPNIVFLDIEMPGHSGLEILEFFLPEEINFSIIFTTAYNEYALQAFKFSAIDYLLKPIQHLQLIEAIERFKRKENAIQQLQLQTLQRNLTTPINDEKRIVVPIGQVYKLLNPKEIKMIKGEGAYSEIFLEDGSTIVASKNLKHFEDILQPISCFFRCHKSYLVNIHFVVEYVKSDGGYLTIKGGQFANISGDKIDIFLAKLA